MKAGNLPYLPPVTMSASAQRFDEQAEFYHRYRPSYPPALVDWVIEAVGARPGAAGADAGCGTGIATRLFAARGFPMAGIEPSESMLRCAREAGGAEYRQGTAEATGLADGSVDFIISAQAMHWFDLPPTFREWKRILRPGGGCAAFWNKQEKSGFRDAWKKTHAKYPLQDELEIRARRSKDALRRAIRESPEVKDYRETRFHHEQVLDRESFLGRVLSGVRLSPEARRSEEFRRDFEALFDRFQRDGFVRIPLRAHAVAWRFR